MHKVSTILQCDPDLKSMRVFLLQVFLDQWALDQDLKEYVSIEVDFVGRAG